MIGYLVDNTLKISSEGGPMLANMLSSSLVDYSNPRTHSLWLIWCIILTSLFVNRTKIFTNTKITFNYWEINRLFNKWHFKNLFWKSKSTRQNLMYRSMAMIIYRFQLLKVVDCDEVQLFFVGLKSTWLTMTLRRLLCFMPIQHPIMCLKFTNTKEIRAP